MSPQVPIAGWLKTAVGASSWSGEIGLSLNTVSAKQCPSRIAAGVRLSRSVTSPTAQTCPTLVRDQASTRTAPFGAVATPAFSSPSPAVFGCRPVA